MILFSWFFRFWTRFARRNCFMIFAWIWHEKLVQINEKVVFEGLQIGVKIYFWDNNLFCFVYIPYWVIRIVHHIIFFCMGGDMPALVPDKWIFSCKVSYSYSGNDFAVLTKARHHKLVHVKVANWCWHWYFDSLDVMLAQLHLFFAWYFKCPELTQP